MRIHFYLFYSLKQKVIDKDYIRFSIFGLYFQIHKKRYLILLLKVWVGMLLILFLSSTLFGYEMTNADLPGGACAGILLAYFIHMHLED